MHHPSYQKRPNLSSQSKDLLLKLDMLKQELQRNVLPKTKFVKTMSTQQTFGSGQSQDEDTNSTTSIEQITLQKISSYSEKLQKIQRSDTKIIESKNSQKLIVQERESEKLSKIRQNIIGFNTRYMSPFNIELESVYVDHTATNRPYKSVQDMIAYAKRFAANPHTEFSHFGKFSTEMMRYAHNSLLKSFSADSQTFIALPTGSGSTGAIEKTLKILKSIEKIDQKPTVFITPYQHHSNILPWVQYYDNVNVLACDQEGNLLIDLIEEQLLSCPTKNIIVSISAASNVTSTLTDLEGLNKVISTVRKSKDIIFAVDCAAYCCHKELNLQELQQIDFVYLSPHKNLGGAESCGVIIARKSIMKNAKPTFPGGGTVAFVKGYNKEDVMYDTDVFNREIAGTPPFIGFYRAALSFELLKNDIGYDFIHEREEQNTKRFLEIIHAANLRLKQSKIVIYGEKDFSKRANVITFNIVSKGHTMQHNLVSLILADVFGVQLRSGCFCAGPFGMRLLKLDEETVGDIKDQVSVGILKSKPGYLRLDLAFYLELYEIEYIANAIIGVAEYSKSLGLVYTLCNDGEINRHKLFKSFKNDKYSLSFSDFVSNFVRKDEQTNEQRLSRRRETLEKQYKRGMNIVTKPIEFLRSQIQSQTN